MPIAAQLLADRMRFALDAEDSDHYNDTVDIIPAINAAQDWLIAVVNATFGNKRMGEEIFRDVHTSRVFVTSVNSRISLDVFPHDVWGILAVYPKPTLGDVTDSGFIPPKLAPNASYLDEGKFHISSSKFAERLTIDQWSSNKENPFQAGFEGNLPEFVVDFAYLNPVGYDPDSNISIDREIEIRPSVAKEHVTVFYARRPKQIQALTEDLEFPNQAIQLLLDKALQYISFKQGDQTTLFGVTQSDINLLLQALN